VPQVLKLCSSYNNLLVRETVVQSGVFVNNSILMNDCTVAINTLRDLMQCVQAARDGVPEHSLFALQCDLVLQRASQVLPDVIVPRSTDRQSSKATHVCRFVFTLGSV
jgi:hypothetical protein